ncbi:hypothetical protein FDI21_gp261 [Pseudomonas phage Noxifer]|uniref:Uncharacterized protein n=1 Tax=Pseudomonas phage Noxifer TaxID=2006684 RepID=A0A1Y0SVJ7_9CAUD|nr:hypothetical protein FDI21_gp261 [Pseudomonas phage Noxifer]ARV77450.1 hypothetical protein NOXIFER_285 [Pseudomonas phage Noxifer]
MEALCTLFTIYFFYRSYAVYGFLTGPLADANIQILTERFITGPRAGFISCFDGSLRGITIGWVSTLGYPLLTTAVILHTCVTAAGITTAIQRHWAKL